MIKSHSTFTIDADIIEKARAAGINMSEAAENGIRHELIRIGGDIKTLEEILVEKDMKERQRKAKDDDWEATKALSGAQGKLCVDEKSPATIDVSKFMRKRK